MGESMKSPFGIYPVYPLEKNQLAVVLWDKHCGPHACSIQIWITRTPPPPPFNTSAFYQHVGISPGILGPHGHLTSNTWFCSQLQQGMAKGTMTCRDSAWGKCKNTKLSSPIGHWGVLGSGLGCIIDICWWSLLVYEGFLAICQIQYTTPYYLDHPLRYFVTCLHIYLYIYIYIEKIYIYIIRKYIYIYVDS